ncbi:hypothetical protein KM043_003612 [Ampulex compressa]|nr:hypothetical protein KM043_003612 [Ampulex compressa]
MPCALEPAPSLELLWESEQRCRNKSSSLDAAEKAALINNSSGPAEVLAAKLGLKMGLTGGPQWWPAEFLGLGKPRVD